MVSVTSLALCSQSFTVNVESPCVPRFTGSSSSTMSMPIIHTAFGPSSSIDRDGDIIMSEVSSMSPPESAFVFEFSEFDNLQSSTTRKNQFIRLSPKSDFTLPKSADDPTSGKNSHSPSSPLPHTTRSTPVRSNDALVNRRLAVTIPSPPTKPLSWIWICHLCRSRYPLHVTRRCLIDGHYYCSGEANTSPQRNLKRKKRAQACSSEFDYVGWKDWGKWKRKALALRAHANGKAATVLRGCEGCEFPSQCRYEEKEQEEILKVEEYLDSTDNLDENDRTSRPTSEESKSIDSDAGNISGLGLKIDTQNQSSIKTAFSSNLAGVGSGGRFYANIYNNLSNTDLASPSQSKPTRSSGEKRSHRASQSDLAAIEKVLKIALTEEKQKQRQKQKRSSVPEMAATGLHRSHSHQSLLSDLFENNQDKEHRQIARSGSAPASSAAKPKSPTSLDSPVASGSSSSSGGGGGGSRGGVRWKKRRSNVTHFEDIALSSPLESAERMDSPINPSPASVSGSSKEFEDLPPGLLGRPSSWTGNVFGRLGRFGSAGEDKT